MENWAGVSTEWHDGWDDLFPFKVICTSVPVCWITQATAKSARYPGLTQSRKNDTTNTEADDEILLLGDLSEGRCWQV